MWIARDAEVADRVAEELQAWLGGPGAVVTLEPRTALAYERSELIRDESAARVAALAAWRSGSARVLVASVQALFQHTLPPSEIPDKPLELRTGQRMSQERVLRELIDLGYEVLPEVAGRGEFARRGGIVDVFPAGQPLPVRIEWFGDEIESLRAFDPANQRGIRPGGGSSTAAGERVPRWARAPATACAKRSARLSIGSRRICRPTWRAWSRVSWRMQPRSGPACSRQRPGSTTSATTSCLIDEPADVDAAAEFLWSQHDERRAELERAGVLPKSWPPVYVGRREWKSRLTAARTLELTWESEVPGAPPGGNPFGWHEPVLPPTPISDLAATIGRWRREGQRVVLASDQSARLSEILGEADIVAAPTAGSPMRRLPAGWR